MARRPAIALLGLTLAVPVAAACGDDGPDATATAASSSAVPTTAAPTTAAATTVVVPEGILAAIPFQNRPDAAVGRFQVKVVNGSPERIRVRGVQLVWSGATTDVVERDDVIVAGQRTDLPVPIPTAACAGDGAAPDTSTAVVLLDLEDATQREVPVYDVYGVLARLHAEDCERQLLERAIGLEWADLREATLDGRPVTEGVLRVTRRDWDRPVTVTGVRGTVIFGIEALTPDGSPTLVLDAGEDVAELPVRFVEARCDSHAQAEVSTPVNFLVDLDLGDGIPRVRLVLPTDAERRVMRERLAAGCEALGGIEVLGQPDG